MNLKALLGKNYKWWYLLKYSFLQGNLKIKGFLINQLGFLLDLTLTMLVWQNITKGNVSYITYFFVGFMISHIGWSSFSGSLASDIVTGKFNTYILRPTNFFGFVMVREIGSKLVSNIITSFSVVLLLPMFWNQVNLPSNIFLIFLPIILATVFFVDYCISLLLASIAFWDYDYGPWMRTLGNTVILLMGTRIPFYVFPSSIKPLFEYSPLGWSMYQPIEIYLSKYTFEQTFIITSCGIGWFLVLFLLVKIIYKAGLKRNEAVGL